jgi:carboxyl-terminal processing protease
MKSNKLTDVLLYLSLAIFLFGFGYKMGESKNTWAVDKNIDTASLKQSAPKSAETLNFDLFWETWKQLQTRYIDKEKLTTQKMFYGAIKGLVQTAEDPYTFFLTPEENQQAKDDLGGKFEGIGAQLGMQENRIMIVAPIKNSPAMEAGLRAGDYINKVDGQSTRGWTLPQTVSKIRGKGGTTVTLTIQRNGKEQDIKVTRRQIHVPSVELTYEKTSKGNVANLRLNQFGDTANDEWDVAVEEIQKKWINKEITSMVLDLRDNPGGYLESSVYIASEFIPQGKLVVKQESSVSETRNYNVDRQGQLLDIPLVVMINKGSASASEILAGALRDYKRAQIVGEKSFGKGSVQEALDLKDGAGLHVTVAKWILPNGDWIHGKGIEPNVTVTNEIKEGNTITKETDKQLQKALEIVGQ